MEYSQEIEKEIQEIIAAYEVLVKGIDVEAKASTGRAYGGIIRAGKGKLVESIAEQLATISWKALGQNLDRITFDTKTVKVPIKKEYVNKIKNPSIKKYLLDNINKYVFKEKADRHVFIDGKFIMAIECKAFTENAMMKRILVDFSFLKQGYPNIDCVLLQLESQLGGDYSELKDGDTYGSPSTHTLLSNFDIDLCIITLIKGERKVDKPIHKTEYYKPLTKENLYKAVDVMKELLIKYVKMA